jgi:membrane associated rhomboid family serine protease
MEENPETIEDSLVGLVEVGSYPTLEKAHEHALVVLAMRQPCLVTDVDSTEGYTLHAEPESASAVSKELADYDSEQITPVRTVSPHYEAFRFSAGWGVYGLWAAALIVAYIRELGNPSLADLGASSSIAFMGQGEWWRPFTSLFLHADLPHLVGNLLSGMLFGTLVSKCLGALRGWTLILLCGTAGNAITSAVTYPQSFTSVGASTAVFGALGILSGIGFLSLLRARLRLPWVRITAPLVAGVILLGWMGGGSAGSNTDVLGHVFGFTSGLAAGLGFGFLSPAIADASTAGTSMAAHDGRI